MVNAKDGSGAGCRVNHPVQTTHPAQSQRAPGIEPSIWVKPKPPGCPAESSVFRGLGPGDFSPPTGAPGNHPGAPLGASRRHTLPGFKECEPDAHADGLEPIRMA